MKTICLFAAVISPQPMAEGFCACRCGRGDFRVLWMAWRVAAPSYRLAQPNRLDVGYGRM